MTTAPVPPVAAETSRRTAQDYIDETPVWRDGTPVAYSPMTRMQWFIWGRPPLANSSKAQ
jgi:hypothetical protein